MYIGNRRDEKPSMFINYTRGGVQKATPCYKTKMKLYEVQKGGETSVIGGSTLDQRVSP